MGLPHPHPDRRHRVRADGRPDRVRRCAAKPLRRGRGIGWMRC